MIKHGERKMRLTSLMVVFLISRATVFGRLNVNVALNRPTFASSTYIAPNPVTRGPNLASNAVDGNHDTAAMTPGNSCFVSLEQSNPWWAVDLGAALAVVGILFTNRADGYGYRSDNFIVGLTDMSPAITAPSLWNYDLCDRYPGVVGNGATVNLTCTSCVPPRRYLIVQIERHGKVNFCEIEVYVRDFRWNQSPGKRMINKVASTFHVERRVYCMANCTFSPVCDSYNYREVDKTCQFNTHDTPRFANSTDIVDDSAWGWWSSVFAEVV